MLGTGSHSTHTAIAQWIDGEVNWLSFPFFTFQNSQFIFDHLKKKQNIQFTERTSLTKFWSFVDCQLYVCESTGQTNYWPPPWGIIKTPYRQWIQQAIKAEYEVVILKVIFFLWIDSKKYRLKKKDMWMCMISNFVMRNFLINDDRSCLLLHVHDTMPQQHWNGFNLWRDFLTVITISFLGKKIFLFNPPTILNRIIHRRREWKRRSKNEEITSFWNFSIVKITRNWCDLYLIENWSWIDTPKDNYPPPLNAEILLYFFILFQHVDYDACNRLALLGMNKSRYIFSLLDCE